MNKLVGIVVGLILVGVAVAIWLLPDPRDWDSLGQSDSIAVATLVVGLLALGAASAAVFAAIIEVRKSSQPRSCELPTGLESSLGLII